MASLQSEKQMAEKQPMLALQPVFDSHIGVIGYELLFRLPGANRNELNPTKATAHILESIIRDFDLNKFFRKHKTFINVTRAFIDVITEFELPPEQLILDLPRSMPIDSKLITKLEELRGMGYGLSVNGPSNLKKPELMSLATIFQIDVQHTKVSALDSIQKRLWQYENLTRRATKIETGEELHIYLDRGFDYLQGYFLAKPCVYSGQIPENSENLIS